MKTRLIIIVILLAGILFLLNRLTGYYVASIMDRQLQQITEIDPRIHYQRDSFSVNPVSGSLDIEMLTLKKEDTLFEVKKISGSLTFTDILRILISRSDTSFASIRSFHLTADSLSIYRLAERKSNSGNPSVTANPFAIHRITDGHSDDRNPSFPEDTFRDTGHFAATEELAIREIQLMYKGRPDELINLTSHLHLPRHNHHITLLVNTIACDADGEIYKQITSLPALRNYKMPDHVDRLSLQVHYDADRFAANFDRLHLDAPGLTLRGTGTIHYRKESRWNQPESWEVSYDLDAVTHELARLPLPGILGGFSMDTLSVSSALRFDHSETSRHPFLLPGKTSLYLEDIQWYPSSRLTEQYGLLFGMFGFSEQQLPVQSFQATWQPSEDTLRIDEITLSKKMFDVRMHAIVARSDGRWSPVLEGSLTFLRTSEAFKEVIDGIETLFRVELPRRDGYLHFEFSGDPKSPDFDFQLPD